MPNEVTRKDIDDLNKKIAALDKTNEADHKDIFRCINQAHQEVSKELGGEIDNLVKRVKELEK